MTKVNAWIASRSGATMTVVGKSDDAAKADVRVTGVDRIEPRFGKVMAIRNGVPVAELRV